MEPRGALGVYVSGEDRYPLYADVQYPHRVRTALATNIFKIPEHQIRVIAGDIGGAFGTQGWQYPQHPLGLWAPRQLRRPGQWQGESPEAIPPRAHPRGTLGHAPPAPHPHGAFPAPRG